MQTSMASDCSLAVTGSGIQGQIFMVFSCGQTLSLTTQEDIPAINSKQCGGSKMMMYHNVDDDVGGDDDIDIDFDDGGDDDDDDRDGDGEGDGGGGDDCVFFSDAVFQLFSGSVIQ